MTSSRGAKILRTRRRIALLTVLVLGVVAAPGGVAISAQETAAQQAQSDEPELEGTCGRRGADVRLKREDTDRGVRVKRQKCDLRGMSIRVDNQGAAVPEAGDYVSQSTHLADGTHLVLTVEADRSGDVIVLSGEAAEAGEEATTGASAPGSSSAFCGGSGNSTFSGYWHTTPNYYINISSYPRYASSTDWRTRITNASSVWRLGTNRCGYGNLTSRTGRSLTYVGDTSRFAGISDSNICSGADGASVVSGGDLPGSGGYGATLGSNCRYGSSINNSITESDIKMDGYNVPWIAPGTPCNGSQWDLYSVLVHEFGHFLGMAHVSESTYPTLVMSPQIGPCEYNRTLGQGDYNGIYYKYPSGT